MEESTVQNVGLNFTDWRGNLILDVDATLEPDALSAGVRRQDQDTNQNQTLNDEDHDSDHDDEDNSQQTWMTTTLTKTSCHWMQDKVDQLNKDPNGNEVHSAASVQQNDNNDEAELTNEDEGPT